MKKVILNQKSYLLYEEMLKFKDSFDKLKSKKYEFIIFPPVLYLSLFKNSKYKVGSQNFYSYKTGSFTGELNLESLKDINIEYIMVSHFERRKLIEETYSMSKEKLFKSLNSKCQTILFVGEQKKTRNPFSYIKKELMYFLKEVEESNLSYLSIAYEPNWAIGSGDVQCIDKIKLTINKIKKYINDKYNKNIEVYYGGSIDKDNINEIFENTDGVIIGKPSTNIEELKELLKYIDK
ncbi:MAG: triosephosphate isomerase [Tenericutes bacterium]|nr:triosephosphate isomerase [Mycoplasmatota bacterium]